MITGNLDDRLDYKSPIKFTNYAINKFQGNFAETKAKSIKVKFENCGIKGLKLTQYRTTKRKMFHQHFGLMRSQTIGVSENSDQRFTELRNVLMMLTR